ncbi:hypothetical protein ACFFX0_13520 [Citricoccus parietis]|uniref:Uncharacterized protein n=1 Tax=Citricoccus parietis TaxID=592307 RepID=A0ABV5FZP9_9MICC
MPAVSATRISVVPSVPPVAVAVPSADDPVPAPDSWPEVPPSPQAVSSKGAASSGASQRLRRRLLVHVLAVVLIGAPCSCWRGCPGCGGW